MSFEYKDEYKYLSSACLNLTDDCNLACKYCLTGDTLILLKDGTVLPIKDIKVGDLIIGVEENITKKYQQRTIFPTQVLKISQREVEEYLKITFSNGKILKITNEHPVLNGRGKWTQTKNLREKSGCVMSLGYTPNSNDLSLLENIDYIKGYFLAMWITDGSFKCYNYYYKDRGNSDYYRLRLAVKDTEIIDRMKKYCQILNFDYTIRDFLISEKEQLYVNAIFSNKESNYNFINSFLEEIKENKKKFLDNDNFVKGFLAAAYDAEGHIDKDIYTLSISNSDDFILDFWEQGLKKLGFEVKRDKAIKGVNKLVFRSRLMTKNYQIATGELQMKFFDLVKPAVKRKCFPVFYNSCSLYRNTIDKIEKIQEKTTVYNLETESHTYIANGLAVHNCFVAQQPHYMSLETAKQAVDFLVNNLRIKKEKRYISEKAKTDITYFGGEPTLMWDSIIVPLTKYIKETYPNEIDLYMTTNGTLLNKNRIDFLYDNNINILLSIDGAQETQDFNRPCKYEKYSSFDLVVKNIPYLLEKFPNTTFRSTIYAPTVEHTFENYIFASYMGFQDIFMIPNSRDVWSQEDIQKLKIEIEKIYDFIRYSFQNEKRIIGFSPIEDSFERVLKHDLYVYNNINLNYGENRSCIRCGLGTGFGSIGYDGKIYGCQEQDSKGINSKFYIGNIKQGINIEKHFQLLNEYLQPKKVECINKQLCEKCKLKNTCDMNACPSSSQDLFNSFFIDSEIHCLWQQFLFDEAIKTMHILVKENNLLFKKYLDYECNYRNYFGEEDD